MMTIFRQGDLLTVAVRQLPKGCVAVPREHGKIMLAHGEATGHAHAIADVPPDVANGARSNRLDV
jgi:hypothetical protein